MRTFYQSVPFRSTLNNGLIGNDNIGQHFFSPTAVASRNM